MYMIAEVSQYVAVASFAEAWIEIQSLRFVSCLRCRLLRGGVDWNYTDKDDVEHEVKVASFAEAWIEIFYRSNSANALPVASFAEAWIEIGGGL